ncbi:XdhC family protein [Bacillus sp. FJAT-27245]|uniref:XdhC family protein n=1 Tax=Bacillus sp. FJAT-27245 TaxID=1684144 RepID=UPI0006A7AC84|nr:XdhC family protein [Bacillus sp. FJAT-27245]
METMNQLLDTISLSPKKPMVLATIIHVEGSAYRKEGASILILRDKSRLGLLSAGCLEEDITERATEVFTTGNPSVVHFDMANEDDLAWGRGAGCNGRLTILLEPVNDKLLSGLLFAKKALDSNKAVTRVVRFTPDMKLADGRFFPAEKSSTGSEVIKSSQLPTGLHPDAKNGGFLFVHQLKPRPRLFVFGAGDDAMPVVSLASQTGFDVTVIDWRPAFGSIERFPEANMLLSDSLEKIFMGLSFSAADLAVVMTHHFDRDQLILDSLLESGPLFYLGVLGPRERTERLLRGTPIPEFLHSPVGLAIGAQGPQEIAVSIVAEIIKKIRRDKEPAL